MTGASTRSGLVVAIKTAPPGTEWVSVVFEMISQGVHLLVDERSVGVSEDEDEKGRVEKER